MTLRPLHFAADNSPLPPCANQLCDNHVSAQDVANGFSYCSEDCQLERAFDESDLFDDPELLDAEQHSEDEDTGL